MSSVPRIVPVFNPIAKRLLRFGSVLGPNALLTVRGRKSGQMRTTPVALVEIQGRRWVIGTFGDVNWVRNLRAAREGVVTIGRREENVRAVELSPDEGAAFFSDVVGPYVRRLRVGPWLLSMLKAREVLDDPASAATRRPVFELILTD